MDRSRYGNLIVLNSFWLNQLSNKQLGFIKCRDVVTNELKFFIGNTSNFNEDEWEDVCYIIDNGQKLSQNELENIIKG